MSDYIRVTIACPEDHIADANQLARVLGYGPDDDKTFSAPVYKDGDDNLYSVASGLVKPQFLEDAFQPLIEPEWGADMEAAERAQALVMVGGPADPSRITAIIGDDPDAARVEMGISRISEYPEQEEG